MVTQIWALEQFCAEIIMVALFLLFNYCDVLERYSAELIFLISFPIIRYTLIYVDLSSRSLQ